MKTEEYSGNDGAAGVLSLAELLNVLYRWRGLVLGLTLAGVALGVLYGLVATPRHSARAQVRPGVVAYAADGSPLREWALEDVVRWFEDGLYWAELQTQPEFADQDRPDVEAEFIPVVNFVGGGNVVTLTTLAPGRDQAELVLNRSIAAFNRMATLDTLGSTVHLTRRDLALKMEKAQRDLERIEADDERVKLQIEQRRRDLDMLRLERQNVELDLKELETLNAWRSDAAAALRNEVAATTPRLRAAEQLLAAVMSGEEAAPDSARRRAGDPVTEVLLQTAGREQAGRVGELLETVSRLERVVTTAEVRADSLETAIATDLLGVQRLQAVLDIELAKKEADVQQAIRDLQIQLERDLPHLRSTILNDWNNHRLKSDVLSPLERVGVVSSSEKPVRPRKARAVIILTVLAGLGSVVLAFVLEYLRANLDVITAARRRD